MSKTRPVQGEAQGSCGSSPAPRQARALAASSCPDAAACRWSDAQEGVGAAAGACGWASETRRVSLEVRVGSCPCMYTDLDEELVVVQGWGGERSGVGPMGGMGAGQAVATVVPVGDKRSKYKMKNPTEMDGRLGAPPRCCGVAVEAGQARAAVSVYLFGEKQSCNRAP